MRACDDNERRGGERATARRRGESSCMRSRGEGKTLTRCTHRGLLFCPLSKTYISRLSTQRQTPAPIAPRGGSFRGPTGRSHSYPRLFVIGLKGAGSTHRYTCTNNPTHFVQLEEGPAKSRPCRLERREGREHWTSLTHRYAFVSCLSSRNSLPFFQFLLSTVSRYNDLYLDELRDVLEERCGVAVNESTIWRTLQRAGFRLKEVCCRSVLFASVLTHFYHRSRNTPSRGTMCIVHSTD